MTNEEKRMALGQGMAVEALKHATDRGGPLEETVVLVADEADPNAGVLLRALSVEVEPGTAGTANASLVVLSRDELTEVVQPIDAGLAAALAGRTKAQLTVVVVAHSGWSTLIVGDNSVN